jgi:hypothetical protein
LACKRSNIPLEVILKDIKVINPKYKVLIKASKRGDKVSPKYANKLGLGKTRISPKRWKQAILNVSNKKPMPMRIIRILEVLEDFINNGQPHQSNLNKSHLTQDNILRR